MKVSEFARDMNEAPSSEDRVVVRIAGSEFEVAAVQFEAGKVTLMTGEVPGFVPPVALAEQTADDQAAFSEGESIPGHADVMNQIGSGEGIASDIRGGAVVGQDKRDASWSDRGQEYNAGPEQSTAPVEDDQLAEDSGT